MPIESLLAPAEQVQTLCAFLAGANHQLSSEVAEQVVNALHGTDKQAAQQLRAGLTGCGIHIKHMHALKAINVIRGTREYRALGETVEWEVASWFDDAPACAALRCCSSALGEAADVFIKELSKVLAEESEFLYARVIANDHSVEITFVGEPIGHQHWLLACTDGQGNAKPFPVDQQAKFVERVRRTVEGQHDGWVDGVFALQTFHQRITSFRYLVNAGMPQTSSYESEIVAILESHAQPATAGEGKPAFDIEVDGIRLTGEHRFKLLARYHAWSSRYDTTLADLIAMRLEQEFDERFPRTKIEVAVVRARVSELDLELGYVAEQLGISAQVLNDYVETEAMPVALIAPFAANLRIAANAIYSEENFRPPRMTIDAEMVAMTLSRFPHVEVETDSRYGTPQYLEDRLEALCIASYAQRKNVQGDGPSKELLALAADLEVAGMQFCLRINPQFVQDLPLGRERLAQIAALSIVDTAIISQISGQSTDLDGEDDEGWSDSDERILKSLNEARIEPMECKRSFKDISIDDRAKRGCYVSTLTNMDTYEREAHRVVEPAGNRPQAGWAL